MSAKVTVVSMSVALALAVCSSVLYVQLSSETEAAAAAKSDRARIEGELRQAREDAEGLREELENLKESESALRKRWSEERTARLDAESSAAVVAAKTEDGDDEGDDESDVTSDPESEPVELANAVSAAQEMVARGDLRSLWRLLFDVIEHGEEGYAKGIEIAALLNDDEVTRRLFSPLWNEEELMMGPVMRDAIEHDEAILRFALHLRNNQSATGFLKSMSDEIADEMGAVLLGLYGGDDPEIHNGYYDLFRTGIEKGAEAGNWRRADDLIRNLAHVRSEKATEYLVELLGRAPPSLHVPILRSLSWHRTSVALEGVREFRQNLSDERSIEVADATIRLLE